MSDPVKLHCLESGKLRLSLPFRKRPYWVVLCSGEHLGYYRGRRAGRWIARYRHPGGHFNYQESTLAGADDDAQANGETILDFSQARDACRKWTAAIRQSMVDRQSSYLISDVLDDYIKGFSGKDFENTRRRIDAIIRPQLGHFDTAELTTKTIIDWHLALANSPARLRTAPGAVQNFKPTENTADARRRRRSSANRILTILKAALNVAYRSEKISSDDAWRRVRPFGKTEAARLRYLSDDETWRLVNACSIKIRPLVTAALLTGARYSELTGLEVRDFDRYSKTLWLRETKAGTPRAVYLEAEGVELLCSAVADKGRHDLIFPRPDGKRWGAAHQARPMLAASEAAGLEPVGFHDLRRTFGARLAMKGVPIAVIAEALGHSDERITRKHYAHLAPSYVADTIRNAVTGLGIV